MIDVEGFDPDQHERQMLRHKCPQLDRWRELRSAGVAAGSEAREVAELRRWLMDHGYWAEVYR